MPRHRWLFTFSISEDLRFISHRDTMRLFERAVARAQLPVRWSEGFNPHPKLTIPLPRPVGIASDVEALVVETTEDMDADKALARLEEQTPTDLRMLAVRSLGSDERVQPNTVRYRLEPETPPSSDLADVINRILVAEEVTIERIHPKKQQRRDLDVRPYIDNIELSSDHVDFTLRVTTGGTVRPSEIAGLLGYDRDAINHRIRRLEVQWQ